MYHRNDHLQKIFGLLVSFALLFTAPATAELFTMRHTFDDPNPTTGDKFGFVVALDANRVLIGNHLDDTNGTDAGQAHLFDASTGALLHTFDDPNPTPQDDFGFSVSLALDGDRVLIGASHANTAQTDHVSDGQAHLFDAASGALLQTIDDPTYNAPYNGYPDYFGYVAIAGDRVLIGEALDRTNGPIVGQAHLFEATSGAVLQTFDDPTPTHLDVFGRFVALDGDRALISAYGDDTNGTDVGQVHLFDASTGALLHTFDNPNPTTSDFFGSSLALDGDRVLIGAKWNDTNGTDVGQAHLFDAGTGALLQTFDDPTPTTEDQFGSSVALEGNRVLIGAGSDDTNGTDVGQVHMFDASSGALLQTFDDPTVTTKDHFGNFGVVLDGNRVLIGSPGDDTNGTNVGQAYLFLPSCDFNLDALCDINDLNAMLAEGPIARGVTVTPGVNDQFDLTGDGVINNDDVDQWLADAATINGFGSPYKRGDANLDGAVDVLDFNAWNTGKFTASLLWDAGNFNGDDVVDVLDFNTWNLNKFTASDGLSPVPEPTMFAVLFAAALGWAAFRRR